MQIEMVWTGSAPLEVPQLPPGYQLRLFQPGDEAAYEDLFHLAFEDRDTLEQTRATALDAGFFVVEHRDTGHLVATCAAQHIENERHPGGGQLGWLVGDPSHSGVKLGRIVSTTVTNRLAEAGYALPYLQTNDFRFAAIAIYLRLGWRPYLFADDMEQRWRDVYTRLGRSFSRNDGVLP
ncbi:MAG: GNAT family N-acetyltransferase [Chloroflexi bacterium]|nr:GNAT family N-acetyltransferase [Chloroflexota bacterium]